MSSHAPHPAWFPLKFISVEAASGVALLVAAAIALAWANSPWAATYAALWHLPLSFGLAAYLPAHDLHFWVNDGLMTLFFLIVGLEIRREMHGGSLAEFRVMLLPLVAAAGGVLAPAAVYLAFNTGAATSHGWAIPTATDIAFAVGVLSLIGPGIPTPLRMLLLTLAIIDDIAAILIIALVYSSGIDYAGLVIVAAGVLVAYGMQWLGLRALLFYALPAAIAWYGMLHAGMHPTLAGVILGLVTPVRAQYGRRAARARVAASEPAPVQRAEAALHPWVAFAIMPLFALANAGVSLGGFSLSGGPQLSVTLGIVLGLVVGKPVGIALAAFLAVRLKWCTLPAGVHWRHVLLLGLLGGIGFTVAIFVANLAFQDEHLVVAAKFAVLVASVLAAVLAWILGRMQSARAAAASP